MDKSDVVSLLEEEFDRQRHCPSCNVELPFKRHGRNCHKCDELQEKARWDSLTVEQKLDELKARMDAAGLAIANARLHVPLGGLSG